MKKFFFCISTCLLMITALSAKDLTEEMPDIETNYKRLPDTAQYGDADWSNVVGIARGISLIEAKKIADNNENITSFFYIKGARMILNTKEGNYLIFNHGDAVFFSGDEWWATAPGLADAYIKVNQLD
jgi:hypothetical protein